MKAERDKELAALLVAGRTGDHSAYRRFLTEVALLLRHRLRGKSGMGDAVEDIIQESLIAIHAARHTYLSERPIGPWVYAICQNRMIDHLRRTKRHQAIAIDDETMDLFATDEISHSSDKSDLDRDERINQIENAMARLPADQRRLVTLLKIEDKSVREVAAMTGMSESAVKVSAHRAYQKIRKWIGV